MKELELVIRIPEEMYEQIKDSNTIFRDDERTCYEAVKNGIPLPKGHGDLIDREMLMANGYQMEPVEMWYGIKHANTIIEADAPKKRKGTPLEENDSGYNCEDWIP